MSCDFGVWYPHERLDNAEAQSLYARICEGDTLGVEAHPNVEAFYTELIGKHPEIDTIPEDRLDDHDYCPWSCALDHSPGHVVMSCVWSKAEYVKQLVHELARKYDLAIYDPQENRISYPDSGESKKAWWKFW